MLVASAREGRQGLSEDQKRRATTKIRGAAGDAQPKVHMFGVYIIYHNGRVPSLYCLKVRGFILICVGCLKLQYREETLITSSFSSTNSDPGHR